MAKYGAFKYSQEKYGVPVVPPQPPAPTPYIPLNERPKPDWTLSSDLHRQDFLDARTRLRLTGSPNRAGNRIIYN